MSLYDGLDIDKDDGTSKSDVAGWSSSFKLLQSQLQAKKANVMQVKKQKSSTNTMAPVIDLKKNDVYSDLHFNKLTGRLERLSDTFTGGFPFLPSDPQPSLTGVIDEYEPLRSNDYEDIVKKRKEQRMKEREEERNKKDFDDDKRYGDSDEIEPPRRRHEDNWNRNNHRESPDLRQKNGNNDDLPLPPRRRHDDNWNCGEYQDSPGHDPRPKYGNNDDPSPRRRHDDKWNRG
jgi:hypothetical protein